MGGGLARRAGVCPSGRLVVVAVSPRAWLSTLVCCALIYGSAALIVLVVC